jgi:Acetokinase family
MNVLLLNAGSSSLKCTLMESADGNVVARGMADWAGSETRYQYAGPDGCEHSEKVSWTGHADAVRRVLHDLRHAKPALENLNISAESTDWPPQSSTWQGQYPIIGCYFNCALGCGQGWISALRLRVCLRVRTGRYEAFKSTGSVPSRWGSFVRSGVSDTGCAGFSVVA